MKQARQIGLGLLAVGLFLLPAQSWAQPQTAAETLCPAGYDPLATVCLNATTGDVVNQAQPGTPAAASATPDARKP